MHDSQTSIFDDDQALRHELDEGEEHLANLDFDRAVEVFRRVLDKARDGVVLDPDVSARADESLAFARKWKSELDTVDSIESRNPERAVRALHEGITSPDMGQGRERGRFRKALIRHLIGMMERHDLFFIDYGVAISDLWLELDSSEDAWRSLDEALAASSRGRLSTQAFGRPYARYAHAVSASVGGGRVAVAYDRALRASALAILLDPSVQAKDLDGCGRMPELRREHGAQAPAYGLALQELPDVEVPAYVTVIDEEHRRAVEVYRTVVELERVWEDLSEREERMTHLREEHRDLFELYVKRLRRQGPPRPAERPS